MTKYSKAPTAPLTRLRSVIAAALSLGLCSVSASAQPSVGTHHDALITSLSAGVVSIDNVNAGCGVAVFILQIGSGARTVVSVVDDEGTGNSYEAVSGTLNNIGTGKGSVVYADYNVSPGDGTLSITVTMSLSITFIAIAVEVCPTAGGTLALDVADKGPTPNALANTHFASASGSLDTASNVVILMACAGDANFGTETVKSTWTALDSDTSNQAMGQYKAFATAVADERSEMSSSLARDSFCSSISIKEVAAAAGGPPIGTLRRRGFGR